MALNFFTADYTIRIHDKIIEISGGIPGIKDYGNIDSPLAHIQNDDYYPTFEEKLTHLIFSLTNFMRLMMEIKEHQLQSERFY